MDSEQKRLHRERQKRYREKIGKSEKEAYDNGYAQGMAYAYAQCIAIVKQQLMEVEDE